MKNYQEYIDKWNNRWSADYTFTYDLQDLKDSKMTTPMSFNCEEHGKFIANPLQMTRFGCPECKTKYKRTKPYLYASKAERDKMVHNNGVKSVSSTFGYKLITVLEHPDNKNLITKKDRAYKLNEYIANHPEYFPKNDEIERLKSQLSVAKVNNHNNKKKLKELQESQKITDTNQITTKEEYLRQLLRMVEEGNNAAAAKILGEIQGYFDTTNDLEIRLVQFEHFDPDGKNNADPRGSKFHG